MIWHKPLILRLGISGIALLAAVAVYLFMRLNPPALLEPFQVMSRLSGSHAGLFGGAPSFFYTLAIGLLIGVCASTRSSARFHCLVWIGLALLLEVSQAQIFATPVTAGLTQILPDSIWRHVGSYWTRGVFDQFDLLATSLGGAIALALLTCFPGDKEREA
jgi:hypothetical protein